MYFYLRAKQLRYLFKHGHRSGPAEGQVDQRAARTAWAAPCPCAGSLPPPSTAPLPRPRSDAAELWRPFSQCDYRAARLLRVRGRPPLAVHVPAAMTGISDASPGADSVRLLGHVVVAYPRPRPARVATTAAALAAAKLRSAAALAATRVPAPQRAGDRRPPLSPSASSGSLLSQASSGSLGSFSGSLRSLAPQGEGSPTPGASAGGGGHSGGGCNAAAPPAAHARPPLPRQAKFIVRELEAAPVQRFDTLRWQQQQQPLAAAAAAAAAAAQQQQQQQRRQSLLPGPGAGTVAAQAALSCQPWGPHAALAQHHVAVL